jgi:ALIX V-shaped domain binding to HIV
MSRGALLPFKISEDLKLWQILVPFFTSKFLNADSKDIMKFSQMLDKQRKILDFPTIQRQVHQDYRLAVEFEPLIIQYYSNLIKLEFILSKCFNENEVSTPVAFAWNNSFNPKSHLIELEDLNYEIISILYNLSITYYFQGIYFISFPVKSEKLKGVNKLRNFLWILAQIESRISKIDPDTHTPYDLNPNILKSFSLYAKGLSLSTFAELLESTDEMKQKLAGTWMKAGSSFEEALLVLNEVNPNFAALKTFKDYKNNVTFNLVISKSHAYQLITKILELKAREDSTKGYMGNCVYYTGVIKEDLDPYTKKTEEASSLTKEQKEMCIRDFKMLSKLLEERTKLNDKLYVDKEIGHPDFSSLYIETNKDISLIEPTIIEETILKDLDVLDLANEAFDGFMMKLQNRVDYYSYEIEREMDKFDLIKETIYKKYDVHAILAGKYRDPKDPEIPEPLREKIELFNERGGLDSLLTHASKVLDMRAIVRTKLNKIEKLIADEEYDDEILLEKYGKDWDRVASSSVNKPFKKKLKGKEFIKISYV